MGATHQATLANYNKYFGSDALVPGYCGKCLGSGWIGADLVCKVYAEDSVPRIVEPYVDPPSWCPIRSISQRYAVGHDEHITDAD